MPTRIVKFTICAIRSFPSTPSFARSSMGNRRGLSCVVRSKQGSTHYQLLTTHSLDEFDNQRNDERVDRDRLGERDGENERRLDAARCLGIAADGLHRLA